MLGTEVKSESEESDSECEEIVSVRVCMYFVHILLFLHALDMLKSVSIGPSNSLSK